MKCRHYNVVGRSLGDAYLLTCVDCGDIVPDPFCLDQTGRSSLTESTTWPGGAPITRVVYVTDEPWWAQQDEDEEYTESQYGLRAE